MIKALLDALVPIFAGLLLGYCAGRRKWMDNLNLRSMIFFVMSLAVPAALFSLIVKTPRNVLQEQRGTEAVIAICFCSVFAMCFYASRWRKYSLGESAVTALTFGFPNCAAIAVVLLSNTFGPKAGLAGALSIAVGAITISPTTLLLLEYSAAPGVHGVTPSLLWSNALRAIKRPIVWAPAIAIVLVFLEVRLPSYGLRSLEVLGSAGTGAALILTGLLLSSLPLRVTPPAILFSLAKLLIQPGLAWMIATCIHLPADEVRATTLICAIPGGFFGLVFGKLFNVTPQTAGSGLVLTYALSILTLPLWILILNHYV